MAMVVATCSRSSLLVARLTYSARPRLAQVVVLSLQLLHLAGVLEKHLSQLTELVLIATEHNARLTPPPFRLVMESLINYFLWHLAGVLLDIGCGVGKGMLDVVYSLAIIELLDGFVL